MTIHSAILEVASYYPPDRASSKVRAMPRIAYNIALALNGKDPRGLSVCDLGGGLGLFAAACASLGMNATLVDDFDDPINHRVGNDELAIPRKLGVRIEHRDVIAQGVEDLGSYDIVTSFDSMEHWHHSPKALFKQVRETLLKPGGRFVLGVPNSVNLRKRITVPFGINKWSPMDEWYEMPRFRGHVREPDVADLLYIARDMRLKDVQIHGRNWLGYVSRFPIVRALTPFVDAALRPFPTLCSNIYLTGHV